MAEAIADVARVRALLIEAARERRAASYSEILAALGHRFTRPRMRALCRTLDAIDDAGLASGEPRLAVLVVRESDRLPGQGWWTTLADRLGYDGPWTGEPARALVANEQEKAFAFWASQEPGENARNNAFHRSTDSEPDRRSSRTLAIRSC